MINLETKVTYLNPGTIKLLRYCEAHTTTQDPVLYELERETHLKTLAPQMISGHLQGQLLTMLSQMIQPKTILEIGTFTGYATICLAKGLASNGTIHTIEANLELAYIINKYLAKANITDRVQLHLGDALQIIPNLPDQFDLVFIDAGKLDYEAFYDLAIDRVNPGGLIIADNVLWSGKVVFNDKEKTTQVLKAFNQKIQLDERVTNILLPIRDGMMVVRKHKDKHE